MRFIIIMSCSITIIFSAILRKKKLRLQKLNLVLKWQSLGFSLERLTLKPIFLTITHWFIHSTSICRSQSPGQACSM